MSASASIAEAEVRISCGILSSRHDHAKGARPRKRGGDTPGRGRPGIQAGGLAVRSVNILLGTGALLPGACPRSEGGTGTAADGGASPLASARLSRLATARFRDEPS